MEASWWSPTWQSFNCLLGAQGDPTGVTCSGWQTIGATNSIATSRATGKRFPNRVKKGDQKKNSGWCLVYFYGRTLCKYMYMFCIYIYVYLYVYIYYTYIVYNKHILPRWWQGLIDSITRTIKVANRTAVSNGWYKVAMLDPNISSKSFINTLKTSKIWVTHCCFPSQNGKTIFGSPHFHEDIPHTALGWPRHLRRHLRYLLCRWWLCSCRREVDGQRFSGWNCLGATWSWTWKKKERKRSSKNAFTQAFEQKTLI